MRRTDMPLGEIEEVKELGGDKIANSYLKKGWILLDTRVIQLSPEGSPKAMGYYIVGLKREKRVKAPQE